MPPKRTLTQEEKNAKAQKQRERRQNESPAVKEKRLAQHREYVKYNREKRRRLNPMEPDEIAAQADIVQPVQEGEPNEDEADQQQDMDGLGAPLEETMETNQRQEIEEPGVPLEEATEDLNDGDIQPHTEIVPVETETERAYREEFLRELRQQTRQTRTARTHRLAQREVFREVFPPMTVVGWTRNADTVTLSISKKRCQEIKNSLIVAIKAKLFSLILRNVQNFLKAY